jgi:hypothetical protein
VAQRLARAPLPDPGHRATVLIVHPPSTEIAAEEPVVLPLHDTTTHDVRQLERVVIEATISDRRRSGDPAADPALFFEEAGSTATALGGMFDMIGPDNAVFSFDQRDASGAINAAIRIQEASLLHGETGGTRCAIGIALGTTRTTEASKGGLIGLGAATARRLAEAANPGAVFADIDTIAAANLLDVRSQVGVLQGRTHHDYLGPVGHLPSGLGGHTITFVELVWDERPHGLRTDALHDLAWWQQRPVRPSDPWCCGTVRSWNQGRQHGFIVADNEFFYFDDRFIVAADPPPVGSQVWFHARPPLIAGKSRLAVTVVADDQQLPTIGDAEGPAAQVADRAGNRAVLMVGPPDPDGRARRVVAGDDDQPRLA